MSGYLVTSPAREDLFQIWEYIATESGFERADGIIAELHSAMNGLVSMPRKGHRRDDLPDSALRACGRSIRS